MSLSPSAQRVQNVLTAFGLTLEVVEFPESMRSAVEATEAIGCTVGQIASIALRKFVLNFKR